MNRFYELFKMAVGKTSELIGVYVWMAAGAFVFTVLSMSFFLSYVQNMPPVMHDRFIDGIGVSVMFWIYSLYNALSMCVFIVIVTYLIILTVVFLQICYYYDDRSWYFPNWVNRRVAGYWKWQRKNWDTEAKRQSAFRTNMMKAVKKIKNAKPGKDL